MFRAAPAMLQARPVMPPCEQVLELAITAKAGRSLEV